MTEDLRTMFRVDDTVARTHEYDFITQYALYGLARLRENIRDQADHDNIEIGFEILHEKLAGRHEDFYSAWDCWEEHPDSACELIDNVIETLTYEVIPSRLAP